MFGLTPYRSRGLNRSDDFVDFYNMIDNFFSDSFSPMRSTRVSGFKMDVREGEGEYCVEAELPGFSKEDIHLEFDDGRLTISVCKGEEKEEEDKKYIHKERVYSSMQRSVYLPNVNGEDINAGFENGILKITMPKVEPVKKNTSIPIN